MRKPHQAGVRRALTHIGGPSEIHGDAETGRALAHALDVTGAAAPEKHKLPNDEVTESEQDEFATERVEPPQQQPEEEEDRAHVHGFHAYPARMHPVTASRLVHAFAPEKGIILDPFCGSGTILVEALLAGRDALGTDLNPLAVRLARAKTATRSKESGDKLLAAAARVRKYADERRKARAGATRRYDREDVAMFEPHVLLEADSLRAAAFGETDVNVRADLLLVLSAILVKISKRRSDTALRATEKRMAAGYTAKLFMRKAEELVARGAAFEALLPKPRPRAKVREDNATILESVADASVDTILSSPPYAATYDYLMHHALRLRWLGLSGAALADGELGSRRQYRNFSPQEAEESWIAELTRFFAAAARVVRKKGAVILLLADSEANGHPLRAEALATKAADAQSLVLISRASQDRPHFHDAMAFSRIPRREHALYFERR